MTDRNDRKRLHLPVDAFRIVATLVVVWVGVQVLGLVVGLVAIGRHGAGPARHVDGRVHDWFISHRDGMVGFSKLVADVFDVPLLAVIVVVATLAVVALAFGRGRTRWRTFGPLIAYLGAETTVFLVRKVINRPRPASAIYPGPGAVPGIHETSWSFPSGHATVSMAVLVALAGLGALRWGWRWIFVLAVLGAAVVATTRLVLGVHWMTDVATGAVLGGIWGAAVCWAQFRVKDEPLIATGSAPGTPRSPNDPTTTAQSAP